MPRNMAFFKSCDTIFLRWYFWLLLQIKLIKELCESSVVSKRNQMQNKYCESDQ